MEAKSEVRKRILSVTPDFTVFEMTSSQISRGRAVCYSVKRFVFLNSRKKCWIAPGGS